MCFSFFILNDGHQVLYSHTGHFLLANLLLETMKRTACKSKQEGRIVNVSSRRHKFSYTEGIRFDKINDEDGYAQFDHQIMFFN